jgi:hypothetical protein
MKRAFSWAVSNADTLIALGLAVVVSVLGLAGAVSAAVVANATVLTLAVLAFIMLHDRKVQGDTREEVGRLGRKFDEHNPIRILTGMDIGRAIADARRSTEQWFFRGSTATYVRATVIPECIKQARRAGNKEFRARLEMLDPTSTVACENYVRLYQSLADGPGSPEMSWTVKGTRIELYATILAVCWHKRRYDLFTVEIGLTDAASTFRWEASSQYFILTQRGPRFPAMLIEHTDPFYSLLVSELNASFRQARHLQLELAREVYLSDEPTIEEARALFSRLGVEVPADFVGDDISEIIAKALHFENPYKDTGS